jgi:Uncharacterized conserved protein
MSNLKVINPKSNGNMSYFNFSDASQESRRMFALDVHLGLSSPQKFIPSKYFYDEAGSKLFQRITELPEYYLTKAEAEILTTYKDVLAERLASEPFALVEMGAGDGEKTKILLEHFLAKGLDFHYAPMTFQNQPYRNLSSRSRSNSQRFQFKAALPNMRRASPRLTHFRSRERSCSFWVQASATSPFPK